MKRLFIILFFLPLLVACGRGETPAAAEDHGEATAADYERGPHRGRMLRDGDFALEVTIFEIGVPPQFRLYAYRNNQPIKPNDVAPTIELTRLDGEVDRFTFTPEGDYLTGSGTVHEPHSFDVKVSAQHDGRTSAWTYASYEGRTRIPAAVATDAGIKVATAGPATIHDSVKLVGRVALDANRHADVKARFPGIVRAVRVQQGDHVRRGQTLVVVEGNESMRTYPVIAPFDGVVLARNTNVGDVAGDNTLVELADLSRVWVELHAIGNEAARLARGQSVHVESATGNKEADTTVDTLLPLTTRGQSVVVRANLPNADGRWRPGTTVTAHVVVAEKQVPLAVKESALQRFRDFTVAFAQIGDTYEVRMLELGDRDGEYAEVLGGLKPGTHYVAEQSYLIKADIEKSGATHDH